MEGGGEEKSCTCMSNFQSQGGEVSCGGNWAQQYRDSKLRQHWLFFFLTKISFFLLDVFYVKQYVIADFDSLFQWFSLWHISVSLNTYSDKMQCSAQNIIATHFCIKSPCFRQKGFAAHGVACKNALQHEEVLPLSAYFILHVRAHNDLLPSWIT